MGNENSCPDIDGNNLAKSRKSKTYDEFFKHHHKMYNLSHTIDVSSINPKRIVFISITGLWNSWKRCPSISLYNAIIIVPLKQEWIRHPSKYTHQYNYILDDEEFLTLLRWKEHQKLALFMLDNDEDEDELTDDSLGSSSSSTTTSSSTSEYSTTTTPATAADNEYNSISIVWRRLSSMLQELRDPIGTTTNGKYNALTLNEKYWRYKSLTNLHMTEYCINNDAILLELYTVTMRFNTIKLIITESNPTLHVVTNYVTNENKKTQDEIYTQDNECKYEDDDDDDDDDDDHFLDDAWWIADDYYDNSTLMEDTQALRDFDAFVNQEKKI